MRLKAIQPQLPVHLQHYISLLALPPQKIVQSHPLLFTSTRDIYNALSLIPQKLYPEHAKGLQLKLKDIDKLKSEVAKVESAEFVRGSDLLEGGTAWEVGLGIDIDDLINGLGEKGRGGRILEISGGRGSGKTLFSLHLALNHLVKDPSALVVWLDSEGSFDPERAASALAATRKSEDVASILDRLELISAFDASAFVQVVSDIQTSFLDSEYLAGADDTGEGTDEEGQVGERGHPRVLLVVDSVTAFYPDLAGQGYEAHASLVSLFHHLSNLTQLHPFAVVVTNSSQPSAASTSRLSRTREKPALGPTFSYLTDLTLWLEPSWDSDGSDGRVVVQVLKSRIGPQGTFAAFSTDGVSIYPI